MTLHALTLPQRCSAASLASKPSGNKRRLQRPKSIGQESPERLRPQTACPSSAPQETTLCTETAGKGECRAPLLEKDPGEQDNLRPTNTEKTMRRSRSAIGLSRNRSTRSCTA